jgi:hypothetical protein
MAYSQMPGWNYKKTIQIQENSGVNLINYQLELTINTANFVANGEMSPTGNDIRFTSSCSGGTNYSYWIESGMNSTNTKIWVKIDLLTANSTKEIYMHYGNNAASSISAVFGTFNGPHSSTDSVSAGAAGGANNSQRGFRFSPNETLLVTAFGKHEPNGSTRYVTLFDFNTQAIVAQSQVSGPASQYSYSNLTNPIWLQQGTQYLLQLYQGASDGYFFGTSSQIGQHLTYIDMRYCNDCTQNTFPTEMLNNYHYGYPDLWYFTKNTASVVPTYSIEEIFITPAGATTFCEGESVVMSANGLLGITYQWKDNGIDIANETSASYSVTSSGNYSVVISQSNGCSTVSNVVIVTVNPLPTVNAGVDQMICAETPMTLNGSGAITYSWDNGVSNGVVFTPIGSTTYSVSGTDANGCSNSDAVFVMVHTLPTVNAGVDQSICEGTSVTLSASGALTHAWNNNVSNGIAFIPITTTTYSVSGTDGNGCSNTDQVIVTVNPLPNVNAGTDQSICKGDAITLSGTGANAYTWNNNITNTVAFNPIETATYSVSGTDANGCINSDEVIVTVNEASASTLTESAMDSYTLNGQTYTQSGTYTQVIPNAAGCDSTITLDLTLSFTGITEIENTNVFVYPNPTYDLLNIILPTESSVNYVLLDSRGRKVLEGSIQGAENQISLKACAPGAYFLKIGQDEVPIRVIKQ